MNKQRQSIRLKNYDYSQLGYYYITLCSENRSCIFGDVLNGKMVLNNIGNMIEKWWIKIPKRFDTVELDKYQIMPNHLHGVIQIATTIGATTRVAPTVGDIIGAFKSLTTHEYVMGVKNDGWKPFDKRLWQRNYYEHVVRTENDLNKIREYIINNPSMWDRDRNNLGFSC